MYDVRCDCGYTLQVAASKAGNSVPCPKCGSAVKVPTLSVLKRGAGESISLLPIADQIAQLIARRESPFDGQCQICRREKATEILTASMHYLDRRIVSGSGVSVSAAGLKVGYAPSEEEWTTVTIPCLFCDACGETFQHDWRKAKRSATFGKITKFLLLLPVALMAIFLIAILPFVALSLAVFLVYAMYRQSSRKSEDVFLAAHLSKLGIVAKLLDEDEYVLEAKGFQKFAPPIA